MQFINPATHDRNIRQLCHTVKKWPYVSVDTGFIFLCYNNSVVTYYRFGIDEERSISRVIRKAYHWLLPFQGPIYFARKPPAYASCKYFLILHPALLFKPGSDVIIIDTLDGWIDVVAMELLHHPFGTIKRPKAGNHMKTYHANSYHCKVS